MVAYMGIFLEYLTCTMYLWGFTMNLIWVSPGIFPHAKVFPQVFPPDKYFPQAFPLAFPLSPNYQNVCLIMLDNVHEYNIITYIHTHITNKE